MTMTLKQSIALTLALSVLFACSEQPGNVGAQTANTNEPADMNVSDADLAGNPLLEDWNTPFGVPPFSMIEDSHYMPAFKKGVLDLRAEIDAIVANPDPASFENTIVAMEKVGGTVQRVLYTFFPLVGTELNNELRALQREISPIWSRETDAITFNEELFKRVKNVYEQREDLDLDEQDARLLELTYRRFLRAGANLPDDDKREVADINSRLSVLSTQFAQNLLAATKGFAIELTDEADTSGLSEDFKANIWDQEKEAWVVGLNRSVYETFMVQSQNRELRKQLFDGYINRANSGEFDNSPLLIEITQLRAKRAELMGYKSHAHYQLDMRMAKTPKNAEDFLLRVWEPGLAQAKQDRADMQALIGGEFVFEAHDWWHYSEILRAKRFNLDENQLRPYFELGAVTEGAFEMAERLFDVTLEAVEVPVWNEVVTTYEIKDSLGEHLGVFMMDMFARDSKRGGAWMNSYRGTSNIDDERIRPIVTNNMNLALPKEGSPALMRFSEVETLFHEFGHGLHGLLTQIDYPSFSGVDGPRDYTEFPAQILEHWTSQPQMLEIYARHYQTGELIPPELVQRLLAAANHKQGFTTTEYVAASLLDLRWHMLTYEEASQITDASAFEDQVLGEYGLIDEIEPRYRSQYFSHIFAGGYSAGYYAYLWSEILDADGFNAFLEAENIFDPETAGRLKKWIYEAGGLREADELYREFRGKDPSIEPLLKGRGFPTSGS